ncbi:unnamed protein product [Phaedon cochleariae]|uniref:39S ribosomal protein L1, mitochondrial n=1 Tax=Phaedon cochleariae TaxID=80249 RepID=A0A9P0DJ60_PHACE|nr:unnamed protein product [Phaedon cochleariae]
MLLPTFRLLQHGITNVCNNSLPKSVLESSSFLQTRHYAARKGTRERKKKAAAKAKSKVVEQKVGFIPHNQRNREQFLMKREKRKFDDSMRRDPIDNVFVAKYYKWIVYPFTEAVECHRQTHHPDMYNKPNAPLHLTVELNMIGEKQTRFVDNFTRIVGIPHKFDQNEERAILAFTKNPELQQEAANAGALLAGGVELIKQIQNGQINLQDFKFIIAHPEILPELVVLRGLMKRRFPNPKLGTLGVDMKDMVEQFLHGINYSAIKDEYEKDFGAIETVIGTLDMDPKHLEENFAALVRDVNTMRPKRAGHFISRCILWSPPSPEKLKVDHERYIDVGKLNDQRAEEENEDSERIAL